MFWNFFGFFGEFFGNFLRGFFFGEIFLEDFFGRIFRKEFFGRNYFVEINKELMFLSRFWGNFVSIKKEEFKSLEVRGKLIALKNWPNSTLGV
jgi:hypothetical protein